MKTIWSRIEGWLGANAPQLLPRLAAPASDEALACLARGLGFAVPAELEASLRVHDGATLLASWDLLSAQEILAEHRIWRGLLDGGDLSGRIASPSMGVRGVWWSPRWIPITSDGAGNSLCIDLDPAESGRPGQIMTLWHDDGRRRTEAQDLAALLARLAEGLQQGRYELNRQGKLALRRDPKDAKH